MTFNDYIKIFFGDDYPYFMNKYLYTKTMERERYISQFCGCDYTKIYDPRFYYSRFYHSIVVALINYHFTHDKKSTIASLLHDYKTPCFAHTIDYLLGDYEIQESSEKSRLITLEQDAELMHFLSDDKIEPEEILDLSRYPILENKTPRLCADRLDGVLHTSFIWLQTHSLNDIKRVYDDLMVLDDNGETELGFKSEAVGLLFVQMVLGYAKELQSNRNKFVTQYISDMLKLLIDRGIITFEDLYTKKEREIVQELHKFPSWELFCKASSVISSDIKPTDTYSVSVNVKRRNVIPLVKSAYGVKRIDEQIEEAQKIYQEIQDCHDKKYAYIRGLKL